MTFRRAYGLPDTAEATAAALTDDWRHHRACADEDPDLFFPDGVTGPHLAQAEQAKAVCRGCPVMQQCGDWALNTRQDAGVWGGFDENERRLLLRRRARGTGTARSSAEPTDEPTDEPVAERDAGQGTTHGPKITSPCGTPAAYRRHFRHGEKPCNTCRNAEVKRRRARAKASV